ncbi:hypothetical protein K227x_61610 [Rubripirellula lacrimiformis]|uniref:DUF5722 domain-containing protein n=1 Tax=Rubripirellula lacrimiformis TaxID=1930273 RepID=A0A517NL05_9BACT|nr:DUF5722 domain-containing protein [Rubripirellula lacrimiformis]QDT07733.1 hypothetical protein K227x_61610 [Rubripirellula lacrimiformis]
MTNPTFRSTLGMAVLAAWGVLVLATDGYAVQWERLPGLDHDVDVRALDGDSDGIGNDNDRQARAGWEITTTGNDPYIVGRLSQPLKPEHQILQFDYFCPDGVRNMSGFYGPGIRSVDSFDLPPLDVAEGWVTYRARLPDAGQRVLAGRATQLRLDLGIQAGVRLRIRNLVVRVATDIEKLADAQRQLDRQAKLEFADQLRQDRERDYPMSIEDVVVRADTIRIRGQGQAPVDAAVRLVERPLHLIGRADQRTTDLGPVVSSQGPAGHFDIEVPRIVDGRDRFHSAWRLIGQAADATAGSGRALSSRAYATKIEPVDDDYADARPIPSSQKGLSGFSRRGPESDLVDLGIDAVTINVLLSRFVTSSGGPGRQRIAAPGDPVYFDSRPFGDLDPLIDFACRSQMVVSAILLIPTPRQASANAPLVHPDCDGGTYAMPDLTTDRGVAIYAEVLRRLADRYRHTGRAPGGITNWIAHNEIDFHTVWTNMGRQPRELVIETYYRSMRMIHNAAVQSNPHARVFASLTHHWNVPDDGQWKQLSPKEVIEGLQHRSRVEGDFAWGVAYHPYPRSLFAPVAWNDVAEAPGEVRDDLDTPLITIENLEVLVRFLRQPSMLGTRGNVRPVILSEQGFHTDDRPDAQDRQAGSLLYAMQKVRSLPIIESFLYHRWIDHPQEGGLMLGLRGLPSKQHPYGEKKKSWYLYQAFGSPQEATVAAGLPHP